MAPLTLHAVENFLKVPHPPSLLLCKHFLKMVGGHLGLSSRFAGVANGTQRV